MNEKQIANLLKAADAIEGIDPEQFHMKFFRSDEDESRLSGICPIDYEDNPTCGTLGCALGWCVFVKGLEPKSKDWEKYQYKSEFNFTWYSQRIFGIGGDIDTALWDYMFSSDWEEIDNTPTGAAKRMREIANGKRVGQRQLANFFYRKKFG